MLRDKYCLLSAQTTGGLPDLFLLLTHGLGVSSGQCVGTYGRDDVGSVSCGWLHDEKIAQFHNSVLIQALVRRRNDSIVSPQLPFFLLSEASSYNFIFETNELIKVLQAKNGYGAFSLVISSELVSRNSRGEANREERTESTTESRSSSSAAENFVAALLMLSHESLRFKKIAKEASAVEDLVSFLVLERNKFLLF
ncbi:hypothetical protein F2Q69_00053919 [Brassica cretica]|uniref:Uncharacterized protein n=1 Tax=Brassica cretica TaxID=69181 RepID=A0A8S9N860_BRACR|nr:hypothetical protein F2Q69_00053919 [Brassica cretica]